MRIKIAVLDPNSIQRNETLEKIDDYARRRRVEIINVGFRSGPELLNSTRDIGCFDIYILETNMPDINGFYIARELRNQSATCRIIYYTSNKAAALSAFEVNADDYIIKPAKRDRFDRVLDNSITAIRELQSKEYYDVKTSGGYVKLVTKDIAYVNIVNRALCYHMKDGSVIRGRILREPFHVAVQELLKNPAFCIAGASLLVNMGTVQMVERNLIIFNHGEWIVPPRTAFKDLFNSWNKLHSNDRGYRRDYN